MKKLILALSLVVFLFGAVGCKEDDGEPKNEGGDGVLDGEEKYPVEVPFEEYSLGGTSCQWIDIALNEVIVVNSNEELAKYIECTGDSYPEVDFSKNTLLLVLVHTPMGTANSASDVSELLLQQLSANKYELYVEIIPSDADVAMPFYKYIAITIEKTDKEITAELNLTTLSGE